MSQSHSGQEGLDEASVDRPGGDHQSRKIVFIGLLPPPLDGQRVVTKMMLDQVARVAPVAPYNLQPQNTGTASAAKLLRTIGSLPFICAKRMAGFTTLYMAPYSGHGILYACVIAAFGRLLRFRIYAHYHSYIHIAGFSWPMAAFLWACGSNAIHIMLAPQMAATLHRLYGPARRTVVLSNSAFFDLATIPRSFDRRPLRVGHLSNLSKSKGIESVVECAERFEEHDLDVEMVLAGPLDAFARPIVESALSRLKRLRYLGPLALPEVKHFYSEIDVFLFPTRHPHEAEPLVIIDALAAGVPVIATDRGFIGDLLGAASGVVVSADLFVERATEQVTIWATDREALAQASRQARGRVAELQAEARAQLSKLLWCMSKRSDSGSPGSERPWNTESSR